MRTRAALAPLLLLPASFLMACGPLQDTTADRAVGPLTAPAAPEPAGTTTAPAPSGAPTGAAPTSAVPAAAPPPAPGPSACRTDPQHMLVDGAGEPWGVPSSWNAEEPRNSFPTTGLTGDKLHAWGVLDEDTGSDPNSVGYVQVRDLVLSLTYTDGTTEIVQHDPDPTGAAYLPTFAGDTNVDVREEIGPDGATVPVGAGRNYHFWPQVGEQSVDVPRIESVQASYQARLAPGRPADDAVLMQVGVDNRQASIEGTGKPQPQIGQSRKAYVTDQWSCITFTTDPR